MHQNIKKRQNATGKSKVGKYARNSKKVKKYARSGRNRRNMQKNAKQIV